jgi:RNA polymerase sigma factor (sigma-70 family)
MLEATMRAENGEATKSPSFHLPAAAGAAGGAPCMVPEAMMQSESMTDDALMSCVRNGEVQALAPLFDRHHVALFNFYLRTTGNRASSEDLVQDVFVRMLKYRRTYRSGTRFLSWMYQIARRARLDHLRKHRGEIEWDDGYAPAVLPDDPIESAQHRYWLTLALRRLPDDKREVLVLSRFQGLHYDAIAQLLNCQPGAVKVRVHRAMRELREHFHQISQGR